RIRNVGEILTKFKGEKILVVVSAMGKTTNALEKVAEAFFAGKKEEALQLFAVVEESHNAVADELLGQPHPLLTDFYTEIEWLLHDKPVRPYDYYYDQIVCIGEMLSSVIVSHYLNQVGVQNAWVDVRDVIRTDDNFRDAQIDWMITGLKVTETIKPLFSSSDLVLTQGFIGATDENVSTTLGREGSDYSAAVFANLLNAESQTIWKDVQGVMNADPKLYEDAQWIKELNYREVIEMAFYGAQVIHPKTIKPLHNKSIPLYVRSFLHPDEEGTCIHNRHIANLPPIIVYKANQVLLQLTSKDFSFVDEGLRSKVDQILTSSHLKSNLTQNAAISLLYVADNSTEKIDRFAHEACVYFDVSLTKNLTLLTVRHYNREIVEKLTDGFQIVLQQQTPETVQLLLATKA
ncbi:MAG TPA: aspartate kinase, partial [Flavisolibacter sp.]|nr:aspartate kinase [Flavisolibacter sp.]